ASSGVQTTLMKVQKGEQPSTLKPVQSSDEAMKPSGIAASKIVARKRSGTLADRATGVPNTFARPTKSAAATSKQKGAANHHFIFAEKSIAKRMSNTDDIASPDRSNHCSSLSEPTIISAN